MTLKLMEDQQHINWRCFLRFSWRSG